MPAVVRRPPQWAVQFIYMVPSDYALTDRFGAAVDEAVFLQQVEDAVLAVQQWYWDTTGGSTFRTAPAIWFRSAMSTATLFATYSDYFAACFGILAEMDAKGLFDRRSRHRLPAMSLLLPFEGAGNAFGADLYGCPFMAWGAYTGAGQSGKVFGGMFLDFNSTPTTLASSASAGATALTVASGTGKSFAVAAAFHINSGRVQTTPASPTGSASIVCADVSWCDTTPFDAVVWPYGQKPSVANAESLRVTAVTGNTLTVARAQHGTTAVAIQGGGFSGGGSNIARRLKQARIWSPPAQPEGVGFEVVDVTSISGDVLTVVRGRIDAYSYPDLTTARAILAGDNIAVTDPPELWFFQNQDQAKGGAAHELGHNFGIQYINPGQATSHNEVQHNADGSYTIVQRDVNDYAGNQRSVESVYRAGNWQHLPHTIDNPLTPNNYGPFVMFNFWDWPYSSVAAPAAGFTANELARVLASPYLSAQARPTRANTVTTYSFRSASGAIGPAGMSGAGGGSGGGTYAVQPVIWWASDTANDASIWSGSPLSTPVSPSTFLANVNANMLWVRRWYWDNFDGYTFDALPAVIYTSPLTKAACDTTYPGMALWHQGLYDADQALASIDVTDPTRIHFLMTPLANMTSALGFSVFGRCENIRDLTPYGIDSDTPFTCATWASGINIGRDIGASVDLGPVPPDYSNAVGISHGDGHPARYIWFATPDQACGIVAHELGHAFGYQLTNPLPSRVYPHDATYVSATERYNLMDASVHYLQEMGPSDDEKTVFKTSPWLTFHAARP